MSRKTIAASLCVIALFAACHSGDSSTVPGISLPANATGSVTTTTDSIVYISGPIARMSVVLPDSTHVILNPESVVRVPKAFHGPARQVVLDGDACFETSTYRSGPARPFIVQTRMLLLQTRDTLNEATIFRVSAFSRDAGESAQVLSGKVIVHKGYPSRDNGPETLGPGNMVMINQTIDLMEKETFDTSTLVAWKSARLVFHGEPVDSVLHTLEDWFGVTIELKGEPPQGARVSADVQGDRLDKVLGQLGPLKPLHYSVHKDTVTLEY